MGITNWKLIIRIGQPNNCNILLTPTLHSLHTPVSLQMTGFFDPMEDKACGVRLFVLLNNKSNARIKHSRTTNF